MASAPAASSGFDRLRPFSSNTVFKSGPLFISSKGIGWKSWKKRWFILTRTSLVFFKNDPSTLPQRGGEVNLTLGGIDLNNSGSVVIREDKKLLTVLFPDGRDGRAFTLKAETTEDLYEWKSALEQALAQAPNAALVMGHNGIFRNDAVDAYEGPFQQWSDKRPIKSLVVGRPILLALEDIDGSPSFLEKALCFLEKYGTKVEGILRQAADVEEVDRRVQEYEQGRIEFSSDEDPHVVGDCVKHVLRELPSSPVPASCCTALLEAYRLESKEARVSAMHAAIFDTFPEPNRRLLQRLLKMMHSIASHTTENRMTTSAVAACMAPLLLRPLLAGECEMEDEFDNDGDGSAQLLAAANAANSAQAIVTTLLEEYEKIFDDDNLFRCSFSHEPQNEDSCREESTDDGSPDIRDVEYHDANNDGDPDVAEDDPERVFSGKLSASSGCVGSDLYDYKVFDGDGEHSNIGSPKDADVSLVKMDVRNHGSEAHLSEQVTPSTQKSSNENNAACLSMGEILSSLEPGVSFTSVGEYLPDRNAVKSNGSHTNGNRNTLLGGSNGRKNLSVESIDSSRDEELAIQRLELTKNDLQIRIAKEVRGNAILQASLERRKQALYDRRMALEQDVSRLQEQLQAERDLRAALEVGLSMSSGQFSSSHAAMDSKTRAELEEIALAEADVARLKQKVADLHLQLNQQRQNHYASFMDASNRQQHLPQHLIQQNVVQQGFDMSLAFCGNKKKQRNEEGPSTVVHHRSIKQQAAPPSSLKTVSRKNSIDSCSSEIRGMEALASNSADNGSICGSTSKTSEGLDYLRQPSVASSTLVELTTRLDFFKERRSQLMEQLHNLDMNYGVGLQGFPFKPTVPWNSPR